MSKPFNPNLYGATLRACEESGVPEDLTYKAAVIIASDEAGKPDLGRTAEDQAVIKQVLPYLQSRGRAE
ncbi:hypothetical protein H6G81_35035 [Scytonema hofmannii FACHB-248]|uniref:CpcB n=1 Tax=Scytonema hofmannii FACHB-248 TaxID=1842502 RepID=A0ABR8H2I7_9CYAN|nr:MULTISPECIES: hypothetical protein [Nostocales]MBD2609567.1 hypothetical protein [Scytonema hofmannii FACHB-248]